MPVRMFAWLSRYSMPNTESNFPMVSASSWLSNGSRRPNACSTRTRVTSPASENLGRNCTPREHHQRRARRDVLEIDVQRVEQKRRPPADSRRSRQEAVHGPPRPRFGGGDVAARVHRRRERVDPVVERDAGVAGREAGAVALRLGESDVDVAVDPERRRRARTLRGRRVAFAVIDRLRLLFGRQQHGVGCRRGRWRGNRNRALRARTRGDQQRSERDGAGAGGSRHLIGLTSAFLTVMNGQVTVTSVRWMALWSMLSSIAACESSQMQ